MIGAIVLAAGRSERMGGADKLLAPLAGRPLVAHAIATFAAHEGIDTLVVVVSEANKDTIEALAVKTARAAHPSRASGRADWVRVVLGGERRRDSVRAGLEALGDCECVVVHDGARPLVTRELIDAALAGARETGAVLCAVPVSDTVKRADDSGLVRSTVSRQGLWLAQTPQAFRLDLLLRADEATEMDATDDAALVELLGEPVRIVMGSARNLKVTTPADLRLAAALLAADSA